MVGISDQVTNCDRGCAVERIEGIDDKGQRYGEIKRDCIKVLGGNHAEGCYPTPDSVCRRDCLTRSQVFQKILIFTFVQIEMTAHWNSGTYHSKKNLKILKKKFVFEILKIFY